MLIPKAESITAWSAGLLCCSTEEEEKLPCSFQSTTLILGSELPGKQRLNGSSGKRSAQQGEYRLQ